jgi:alpha-1,6-mannosyltransferase
VRVTSSQRLFAIGVVMLVALTFCARNFGSRGAPSFLIPLAVAGIAYLFAIREFLCTARFPEHVIVFGLAIAGLWHVRFLSVLPGPDDDIHRYVWDGRLQRLGYNPYFSVPGDPALASLHTAETRGLNHPELPSPYPPGALLFFRAVTAIHESVFAMKAALVICDIAIVFVLLDVLRRTGQAAHWVLAYAWHPLLAIEVAGSGHIDIVGVLLLLMSIAALTRRRTAAAALTFVLAVAVKLLPIVLLPLYWTRVRVRDCMVAAVMFGVLYAPFLNTGRIPTGSLGTYIRSFRFNDPIFATLEPFATPQALVGLAVMMGLLTAIWSRRKSASWTSDAIAWPLTASLLCAPVIYPWYLLWLLPFMRSAATLPIAIWTVSIIPTYIVWHLRTAGQPWVLPGWVMPVEYGCVAITMAVLALRRIRATVPAQSSAELID